jgi:phosphatidylserine/phosphatidylglycerophosphate/cardiolipin synthase-like enzyme
MTRFRSEVVAGVQIFAVAGTNTVSFGVAADATARKGLLGFAVERVDPAKNERYYLHGFKVFPSVVPHPDANTDVSTFEHPVQSLVWDDFSTTPGHAYTYVFHPLAGTPKNLDRSRAEVSIDVLTEPLYGETHDVFFNRGVASSQAYARRFHNLAPDDQPTPRKRQEALNWLSRDLDEAVIRFIRSARKGNAIRGCFYEFTYQPVILELRAAIDRGVDVSLIIDEKVNEHTVNEKQADGTRKPHFYPSFPRLENLDAIKQADLSTSAVIPRVARKSAIAHNKFMVLLTGKDLTPKQVWTGSTNLTNGGIHGQANTGHWVRDPSTAAAYLAYWTLLASDPGGRSDDSAAVVRAKNKAFYTAVSDLSPTPDAAQISAGVTPVFSPRSDLGPLELYVALLAGAEKLGCATFAFSISPLFKDALAKNTPAGPLCFLLLESEDRPNAASKASYVRLNAKNNVYEASGSELRTALGQWVVETDNIQLGLNSHVAYIHCKFLLHDPLGADPIVVSGSANFSDASTRDNDENMLVIRGDRRVADIYFTEFNRLFNHYYFRSVVEKISRRASVTTQSDSGSMSLTEDDSWLSKYQPGSLRSKRVDQYVTMSI